jgi:mRNA interferase RelE/StbE
VDKFQVVFSPHAARDLDGFSDAVCAKIVRALRVLDENPFPKGKIIRKIRGKGGDYYRLRVDTYRVFYMVEGNRIVVLHILHKKDVGRYIKKLS